MRVGACRPPSGGATRPQGCLLLLLRPPLTARKMSDARDACECEGERRAVHVWHVNGGILPFPPFFPKEMAIFTPPLAKYSPAARIIDPPPCWAALRGQNRLP